jgi:hypothetical protein
LLHSYVKSGDLQNKKVVITHKIGKQSEPTASFTMKTIDDAIVLRNHVISMLEQASIERIWWS